MKHNKHNYREVTQGVIQYKSATDAIAAILKRKRKTQPDFSAIAKKFDVTLPMVTYTYRKLVKKGAIEDTYLPPRGRKAVIN
jgi:DNA-binding MarR family transcriptional regulator